MVHQVNIKISEKKIRQKISKFCFVKKNSVNFEEISWIWIRIRIHFFFSADPGSGSASKLIGSLALYISIYICIQESKIEQNLGEFNKTNQDVLKIRIERGTTDG